MEENQLTLLLKHSHSTVSYNFVFKPIECYGLLFHSTPDIVSLQYIVCHTALKSEHANPTRGEKKNLKKAKGLRDRLNTTHIKENWARSLTL